MANKWSWLERRLSEFNLNQREFADKIGWEKSRVSELLADKRDLAAKYFVPTAELLNVDLKSLVLYNEGKIDKVTFIETMQTITEDELIEYMEALETALKNKKMKLPTKTKIKIVFAIKEDMKDIPAESRSAVIVKITDYALRAMSA